MSNINKDKLEEFFETRIKKQTGAEDWNLPSNDIFLAAMNTVDAEKQELKRKWLILLVAALLTLALSSFLIISNGQNSPAMASSEMDVSIQPLESNPIITAENNAATAVEINTIEDTKSEITKTNATVIEKEISNTVSITQASLVQSKALVTDQSVPKEFVTQSQANLTSAATAALVDYGTNSIENNRTAQQAAITKVAPIAVNPALNERNEIEKLRLLARNDLHLFDVPSSELPNGQFVDYVISDEGNACSDKKACNKMPLAIFAQTSLLQSSVFMKDIQSDGFTLDGYQKFSTGYSLGIGADQALTDKFKLRAAVNWVHFTNTSLYVSEFKFDEANAFVADNGDLMYNNEMVVNTPRTRIAMNDDVNMEESMNQDDLITNKTEIVESYDILQLGIGLHYELFNTGKLSLDLGLTPGINYIFNDRTDLSTILEADNKQMASYNSTENTMEVSDFNQLYFDLNSSANVNYQFANNWTLRFSGLYGQSLNSLKKFDNVDTTRSYFKTRSVALGVTYKF